MLSETEEEIVAFELERNVLNYLADSCAQISREHGFHDIDYSKAEASTIAALALIMSEGAEALEVYRKRESKDLSDSEFLKFSDELADIIIRTFDLSAKLHIDIGTAIIRKMEKNRFRPHLHGNKF